MTYIIIFVLSFNCGGTFSIVAVDPLIGEYGVMALETGEVAGGNQRGKQSAALIVRKAIFWETETLKKEPNNNFFKEQLSKFQKALKK